MGEIKKIVTCGFAKKKVIVIGDMMVDEYITGKVTRLSPEAPVPVLNYGSKTTKAGGASNVACNIKNLGAHVEMCGVAANDDAGIWLRNSLKANGIGTNGIVCEQGRCTSVKTRFATKGQQLLRMDCENSLPIIDTTKELILKHLQECILDTDIVVISDYRKGLFDDASFVQDIISICKRNGVLVCIDSKSHNIEAFRGASFVKPNNLELEAAVSIKIVDDDTLTMAGTKYLELSGAEKLIVTRGSEGISVFEHGCARRDFPAEEVQVYDVTGAGDTVISVISLALSCGLSIEDSVILANKAAGIIISKVGTAVITSEELVKRINEE